MPPVPPHQAQASGNNHSFNDRFRHSIEIGGTKYHKLNIVYIFTQFKTKCDLIQHQCNRITKLNSPKTSSFLVHSVDLLVTVAAVKMAIQWPKTTLSTTQRALCATCLLTCGVLSGVHQFCVVFTSRFTNSRRVQNVHTGRPRLAWPTSSINTVIACVWWPWNSLGLAGFWWRMVCAQGQVMDKDTINSV